MNGIVLKNQNGYFNVLLDNNETASCRSRGKLKKKTDILVGDYVDCELDDSGQMLIKDVYPRLTVLHRPPIANVDQLILVSAIKSPDLDQYLLDKMIVLSEYAGINPAIIINKYDLDPSHALSVRDYYVNAGYDCICTSLETKYGLENVQMLLKGKIIAFSGPSGVGKSSLLNYILGSSHFISGEVSSHSGRGKTTTRHAELVRYSDHSLLMDTPGYTLLNLNHLMPEETAYLFKDFRPYLGKCRFNDCMHDKEPDCAVRDTVQNGDIQLERYNNYIKLLSELNSEKNRR